MAQTQIKVKDAVKRLWPYLIVKDNNGNEIISEDSELHLNQHTLALLLTPAEVRLLYIGLDTGKSSYNNFSKTLSPHTIIRSEILNWILRLPEKYNYVFRTKSIEIEAAYIFSMRQYIDFLNGRRITERQDVINLSNVVLAFDLKFSNCTFKGGINLFNTTLNNLLFQDCTFGEGADKADAFNEKIKYAPSIYAHQAIFGGSLHILGNRPYGNKNLNYESDFKGPIVLTHARIEHNLVIHEVQTNKDILCYFGSFNIVNIWIVTTINSYLSFFHANAKAIYLQNCMFTAPSKLELDGNGSAVSFASAALSLLRLRDIIVLGKFDCTKADIAKTFGCFQSVFISPNLAAISAKEESCINLSNAAIDSVFFSDTITMGIVKLNCIKARNITLSRSKFTNYTKLKNNSKKGYDVAIQINGANITSYLRFNEKEDCDETPMKSSDVKEKIYRLQPSQAQIGKNRLTGSNVRALENVEKTGVLEKIAQIEEDVIADLAGKMIVSGALVKNQNASDIAEGMKRNYTIVVGEADLSGSCIGMSLDCAGGLFYGEDHNSNITNNNALNLKYLRLDGDLFLNDYENNVYAPHFKAIGEVDMHSARINQFFVSPQRGIDKHTRWRVTGLKYEYIYSGGGDNSKLLENCNWFEDYLTQDNYYQPYQQLAAAYEKVGDDTKAKKILILGKQRLADAKKDWEEKFLFAIVGGFSKIGLPASRAFVWLWIVYFVGVACLACFKYTGAFKENNDGTNLVSVYTPDYTSISVDNTLSIRGVNDSNTYYLKNLRPRIPDLRDKAETAPTKNMDISIWKHSFVNMLPIGSFYEDPLQTDESTWAGKNAKDFLFGHKIIGTILLTMFFIGIAKITKKDNG